MNLNSEKRLENLMEYSQEMDYIFAGLLQVLDA